MSHPLVILASSKCLKESLRRRKSSITETNFVIEKPNKRKLESASRSSIKPLPRFLPFPPRPSYFSGRSPQVTCTLLLVMFVSIFLRFDVASQRLIYILEFSQCEPLYIWCCHDSQLRRDCLIVQCRQSWKGCLRHLIIDEDVCEQAGECQPESMEESQSQ